MKLLNRTIKSYVIYSAVLILVFTPLFYFAIQHVVVLSMDDALISHKNEFHHSIQFLHEPSDLEVFKLFNKEFVLTPVPEPRKKDSLYTAVLYDSSTKQEIPHRVYEAPVVLWGKNYDLMIRESMVSNKVLIGYIVGIQLIFIAVMVVGVYFINRRLSEKIWSPFYQILNELRSFNLEGKGKVSFPHSSTVEFRELIDAIKQLINTSKEAYRSQKEFTENASHELQTPLAICRTKLELLAQTRNLTQEQAELVASLLDATDRITRLHKNLLLLSKIENRQFMEKATIDVRAKAQRIADNFVDQINERKLTVEWNCNGEVTVQANPVVMDVLLTNLMSNAVRYTPQNGIVRIMISNDMVEVSNSGMPLKNPEKVFERFHRDSQNIIPGNGLGLSIVKKICDVYSYRAMYYYEDTMHHFKIRF
jgi:signal transduction histidine kinase